MRERILIPFLIFCVLVSGCIGGDQKNKDNDDNDPMVDVTNQSPLVNITQTYTSGWSYVPIDFIGIACDLDGWIVLYEWDFNGDGIYDWNSTTSGNVSYSYNQTAKYYASFRVKDNDDGITIHHIIIDIISSIPPAPEITLEDDLYSQTLSDLCFINGSTNSDLVNDQIISINILIGNSSHNLFQMEETNHTREYNWTFSFDTKNFSNGPLNITVIAEYSIWGNVSTSTMVYVENYRNFTMYISNQDEWNDPVNIKIHVNDILFVDYDFYNADERGVKNHNWIPFTINISCGPHIISGEANISDAKFMDDFTLVSTGYAIIDFWPEHCNFPRFTFKYCGSYPPMFL